MRGRRVLRCSHGHLFSHGFWWWFYGGSFTVLARLGFAGYMHCPVGNHWALARLVSKSDLTDEERRTLEQRARADDLDGVTLNLSIAFVVGVGSLVGALVDHSRWGVIACAAWIAVWGAVFLLARRALRPS